MNDIFKKIFDRKIVKPIFVGFGGFAIFSFIVFPGLTVANGFLNILSALIGIFYYIDADKLFENVTKIESGETELDYVNPEELKPKKKKPNPKMENPKGYDDTKPFVKTRKKRK
jgi:hypothetical protein